MVEADGISVGELDGDSETDSDVRSLGEAVAVDSAECDDVAVPGADMVRVGATTKFSWGGGEELDRRPKPRPSPSNVKPTTTFTLARAQNDAGFLATALPESGKRIETLVNSS